MDVSKTSTDESTRKRHADLVEQTTAAIVAEGLPPVVKSRIPAQSYLPPLPRYEPPASSGHMGFETIKVSEDLPSIEIVREMIIHETRLRLSKSIQDLVELYHTDENVVAFMHNLIQKHVVEHFGYHDVNAIRTALHCFPDDPVVQEAFYVKHNRITQGLINQGQCARDVNLYTLNGSPTTLFSQMTAD